MELMIDAKESRDVRKARCALACRVARHLRAEDQKVMRMPERENGLAEWLRANERSTRR